MSTQIMVVLMTRAATPSRCEYRLGFVDKDDKKPWLRDPDYPAEKPQVNRDCLRRTFNNEEVVANNADTILFTASLVRRTKLYTNDVLFVNHSDITFPTADSPVQPIYPDLSGEVSPG